MPLILQTTALKLLADRYGVIPRLQQDRAIRVTVLSNAGGYALWDHGKRRKRDHVEISALRTLASAFAVVSWGGSSWMSRVSARL